VIEWGKELIVDSHLFKRVHAEVDTEINGGGLEGGSCRGFS
jgi:hypothetical protein